MNRSILVTGDFDIPLELYSNKLRHLREPRSNEEIIDSLGGISHYIVGGPEYVSQQILQEAKDLRQIIVMGTGTSSFVDTAFANKNGIEVCNTPGINAESVAEYALGALIFNLANSVYSREVLLSGGWYQKPHKTLAEVAVGIVGMGDIGQRIARKIWQVSPSTRLYYNSRSRKEKIEQEIGIEYLPLKSLTSHVDVILTSLTYTNESHYLLGAEFFDAIERPVTIFNFSNPSVIDPVALKVSLDRNTVKFAFFDGYYNEWIYNTGVSADPYGLLTLAPDKFVATSHIAAQAESVITAILKEAFAKISV